MANNNMTGPIERLQAEQQAVLLKLSELRSELEVPQEADDPEDSAADMVEHEIVLGRIEVLEEQLKLIEFALQQARQGTYGICTNCGQPIAPARLEAMPEATLCIQCQSGGKNATSRRKRPPTSK